ncbi:hypothetical protein H6G80_18660 [Nostoc sp. FACHB-87]|uniref:hypothetical protein n=1 Tax=Nostocaceae TaxID=1162 RepID=UPI00168398CC|nr:MULTISPECIES: hypothetical protein [Nostocaceae]MBD2301282.1 hypothetical protein [Nostoc sp. FACHB-190]MBD2456090.1 hypothetical protein [Nostoc sp. FACHB-87]MBD2473841.1 hypothetical protein [Anabaena sp. FACHB-83]
MNQLIPLASSLMRMVPPLGRPCALNPVILASVCRSQEQGKTEKRHSNFWIGLYGFNWIVAWHECQAWVEELVGSIRHKQAYYQRDLKAMKLIQQAL